jgi:predicted enzyme related to lactoylglutathione lyase
LVGQFPSRKPQKRKRSDFGLMQIAMTMSNVAAVLPFYRDVLGLTFIAQAGENLAFLTDGTIRVMLSTPQGAGTVGDNSILYFRVKDIENRLAEMVAQGAKKERDAQFAAKMPDHDLWIAFVRDPDNNLIGLMEEKLH